jgi:hypothetical protein
MNEKQQTQAGLCSITHEAIAARAYQLYLERGCQPGHDVDDWLQAEYELRQVPVRILAEMEPSSKDREKKSGRSLVDVVKMVVY